MHRAAEHHHLPIDLGFGQFVLERVHHGFGVTGSAEPCSASTRPLMLQGVPATTGFGLVTWNTTTALKSRAGARLFEHVTAAGAIADAGNLFGVDESEFLRFAEQRVIGRAAAGQCERQVLVYGEHAGAQLVLRSSALAP